MSKDLFVLKSKKIEVTITEENIIVNNKILNIGTDSIAYLKKYLSEIYEEFKFHAYYQEMERIIEQKEKENAESMILYLEDNLELYDTDDDKEIHFFFFKVKNRILTYIGEKCEF